MCMELANLAYFDGLTNRDDFWGATKTRLAKFRCKSKITFYLHSKECGI